ncbi:MAG: hypothetical protein HFJ09_06010 [Lachnospiraceae bacterium]|nr:hypothetical protein [Lachnospiraceae bacterium]
MNNIKKYIIVALTCVVIFMTCLYVVKNFNQQDEVYDEIVSELANYHSMSISIEHEEIDDNDVDEYIYQLLKNSDMLEKSSASKMKNTDVVCFSCRLFKDDEIIYSNPECVYLIGSNRFGKEFNKYIVSIIKNDSIADSLVYSGSIYWNNNDYMYCQIELDSIQLYKKFDISDSNIEKLTENMYETVDDYRKSVYEILLNREESSYEDRKLVSIFDYLIDNSVFNSIPNSLIDEYIQGTVNVYKAYADHNNMSYEEYIKSMRYTEEDIKNAAKRRIKENYILYEVFQQENLQISSDDFHDYVNDIYVSYGFDDPDKFVDKYGKQKIENNLKRIKATEYLLSQV